jgi:hypothetical protein
MRRRLFNLAAVGSLVLCALTIAIWVRSYWRGDSIYRRDGDRYHSFVSEQGTLTSQQKRSSPDGAAAAPKPSGAWKYLGYEAGGASASPVATRFGNGTYQLLGLQFRHETFGQRGGGKVDTLWTAVIPYWLLALATGLWPVAWLRRSRQVRRQRLLQERVCPTCGYDLRASTGRCPECGSRIAFAGEETGTPRLDRVHRASFAAGVTATLIGMIGLALVVVVAVGPKQPPAAAGPGTTGPGITAVFTSAPATQPATFPSGPGSAAAAVQQVFDHIAAGRTADAHGLLYDRTDPAAAAMANGWPELKSGESRLTVADVKVLDDCAVIVLSNVTGGRQTLSAVFAVRKDGGWRVILPAGNYRPSQPGRYPWTEQQRGRMEQLRLWFQQATGLP